MAKDISNKEHKTHWWQRLWQRIVLAWLVLTNKTTPELEKEVDKMLYEKERKKPGEEDVLTTAEKNTIVNNIALTNEQKILKLSNLAIVKDKSLCVALKDGSELQIIPRTNETGHKETSFRIKKGDMNYYIGGIIFNEGVEKIFGKEKGATYEAIENELTKHKGFKPIGLTKQEEQEFNQANKKDIKKKNFKEVHQNFKEKQISEQIFEDTRSGVLITLTRKSIGENCFETSIIYHMPDGDELTTSLKNDGAYIDFSDEQVELLLNESYELEGNTFVLKDAELVELSKEQAVEKINKKYEKENLDEVLQKSKEAVQKERTVTKDGFEEFKEKTEEKVEEKDKEEITK